MRPPSPPMKRSDEDAAKLGMRLVHRIFSAESSVRPKALILEEEFNGFGMARQVVSCACVHCGQNVSRRRLLLARYGLASRSARRCLLVERIVP
jgi:hypothetical protein